MVGMQGRWKLLLLRTQAQTITLPPSLTRIGQSKPHSPAVDPRGWETFLAGSRVAGGTAKSHNKGHGYREGQTVVVNHSIYLEVIS